MAELLNYMQDKVISDLYSDGWEHILDRLRLLDMRIRLQVLKQKIKGETEQSEDFYGLAISDKQIAEILYGSAETLNTSPDVESLEIDIITGEREIAKKELYSCKMGIKLRLYSIAGHFGLSEFEQLCVIAALAVELDRRYETLFAYLNDDITKKYPTVFTLMKLAGLKLDDLKEVYGLFQTQSPLSRYFMNLQGEVPQNETGFISQPLKLDVGALSFLLDVNELDGRISSFTEIVNPDEFVKPLLLGQEVQKMLRSFAEKYIGETIQNSTNIIFHLHGPKGSGKKLQAKCFARYFEQPLFIVDVGKLISDDKPLKSNMGLLAREAALRKAIVCFDNYDLLLDKEEHYKNRTAEFIDRAKTVSSVLFITGMTRWKDLSLENTCSLIEVGFEIPSDIERLNLWKKTASNFNVQEDADMGSLASKFRFTPGQIHSALQHAENKVAFNVMKDKAIELDDIYEACYSQASHHLEEKGTKINPRYGFDDIILPSEQKQLLVNICNQVKYRYLVYGDWGFDRKLSYGKGLSAIFSGPPGTGKTMSAEVIAKELKLELYKIDLSQTVSKYIGETEKNLHSIFSEAQSSNAILFFDEADALFGKRSEVKEAKDRYANIETAYLLQKIEEYEGVTILATNFNGNIDDAFIRRIQYIVEFPFPNTEYREKIWRNIFPEEAPLLDDIDFAFLSERFEISGGNIKNIALSAAFLAAEQTGKIGMGHIIKAAKYELKKMGKILLKEDLGEYY